MSNTAGEHALCRPLELPSNSDRGLSSSKPLHEKNDKPESTNNYSSMYYVHCLYFCFGLTLGTYSRNDWGYLVSHLVRTLVMRTDALWGYTVLTYPAYLLRLQYGEWSRTFGNGHLGDLVLV